METRRALREAFPSQLAADASEIERHLAVFPFTTSAHCFSVAVMGEHVRIPERVHFRPESYRRAALSPGQCDMIECLHTRNHDGFVRERSLRALSKLNEPWVIPFVVRLAGDYVVEILNAIDERRNELDLGAYRRFARENDCFIDTTRSRVISYWNAYHRRDMPERSDYVGIRLLAHLGLG